jgi:hypothetical protein
MIQVLVHFLINLAVALLASFVTLLVCGARFSRKGRCPACGSRNLYLGYKRRGVEDA